MTASVWTWLIIAGVLAVLDWAAVAGAARRLEHYAKPAVLCCLLVAAALARPRHPHVQGWTVAALAFGLLGDLALVLQPVATTPARATSARLTRSAIRAGGRASAVAVEPINPQDVATTRDGTESQDVTGSSEASRLPSGTEPPDVSTAEPARADHGDQLFMLGLLSFLLGHLCYLVAMLRFGTDRLSVGFGLVLALIALGAFGYKLIAGAQAAGGALVSCGVTAYMAALGSAVVLGIGTTELLIAYGILLFAGSDLILGYDRFVQARSWSPIAVITTYHVAQVLLLVGLLR